MDRFTSGIEPSMTEAVFQKVGGGLIPATPEDAEFLDKIKMGEGVRLKMVRQRNLKFHRKFFALMNLAFDYWEPPEHGEGSAWSEKLEIGRNLDRFRKDVTILAGYYDATYRLNGDIRIEAKSIAFASMGEDEFEKLYSDCIDVILKKVCPQYEEEELRSLVDQVLLFT